MPSFRDLSAVAAHLSTRDLPFTWYIMGPAGDAIELEVEPSDCDVAVRYFAQHPLRLEEDTLVPVHVKPRRGASWVSRASRGVGAPSPAFDDESLIGLDVEEAVRRANTAGWLVRAHEREAVLTADHNPGRLNLCYDDDRLVESVYRG